MIALQLLANLSLGFPVFLNDSVDFEQSVELSVCGFCSLDCFSSR